MAYTMSLTREKTYELLELTLNNGARPVIVLEDAEDVAHELFVELLFSDRKDTVIFDYSDFIMNEAFSIDKINELALKGYVIVEDVKFLYGKSATSKILADFAKSMQEAGTGVIFTGKRVTVDMAEFIEQAGENVHYVIVLESE